MALTRKYLGALGIEADKIDEIINAHSDTVNGLKGKIDELEDSIAQYKDEAEKAKDVQKELDDLKKEVVADAKKREGKDYDALLKEFEDYKAEQEKKEADSAKRTAFQALLKDLSVSEKGIEMILKWQGVDDVELDDNGKISNAKDLRKSVKEDWGDYIEQQGQKGADVDDPPGDGAGGKGKYSGLSVDDIMKIENDSERQDAIAENHSLFGF